jgi:alanine racemase
MLSWIEIDRARLKSNLAEFRKMIRPSTGLMVVVKANAYWHG